MTPEQWARVTDLFDRASAMPGGERAAWLAGACEDAAIRAEVGAMLQAYDTDPEFLEQPGDVSGAMEQAVADALVGRRLGAYRLLGQIGRGGMGVVYEAVRDDQEFDRRAAVKVLPVWRSASFGERFRFERRVLAGLDHPGIARLLDAGTTDDGVTYFVLEYVDGRSVTTWCDERGLSVRDRVALAERISEAVAYAHQHLVIHRDLKPANILVTPEGQPKLLDFGIAALVADDGASLGTTRTGQHSFTPEFASPEQARGERVTTATDVYSFGILLYLLLTGRHPYALAGLSPLDVMRTICETDPPAPSRVAPPDRRRILAGDLDAVVLKAVRKAPRERYASMAELAADLRAWRSGHPVVASPATFGYRATRFVRRHRKAVTAASLVALAIVGGGAATAWQARIARAERDKAQNRFRQIQEFSRSLIFDINDALRPVAGATDARRLLLDRAVTFLDGLAADAGDDAALTRELAMGYQRLANLQGNQFSENVGDSAGAVTSLEKAVGLVADLRRTSPDDPGLLALAIAVQFDLAAVLDERGDPRRGAAVAAHAELVRQLEGLHGGNPEFVGIVAEGYSNIGRFLANGTDFGAAETAYRKAVALYDTLPPPRRTLHVRRGHAFALKRLGAVLLRGTKYADSERVYLQALGIDEENLRLDDRPQTRYDITFTMSDLALVQSRLKRWPDAIALWRRALEIREAEAEADPKNTRPLSGVGVLYGRLGMAAYNTGDLAESARWYRREITVRERLFALTGPLPGRVAERSWARLNTAFVLLELADRSPGDPARAAWIDEARGLARATARTDGKASVTAGSEPGYIEMYDRVARRLGSWRSNTFE
jgi:non-specific serine/threonine protein kinase/serine/threonine-protein kinase